MIYPHIEIFRRFIVVAFRNIFNQILRERWANQVLREELGNQVLREGLGNQVLREGLDNQVLREGLGNQVLREGLNNQLLREGRGRQNRVVVARRQLAGARYNLRPRPQPRQLYYFFYFILSFFFSPLAKSDAMELMSRPQQTLPTYENSFASNIEEITEFNTSHTSRITKPKNKKKE